MPPEVLLFKIGGPTAVFAEGGRRAMQEGLMAGAVKVLQFADQIVLGKVSKVRT
jgi:hypothetical protein